MTYKEIESRDFSKGNGMLDLFENEIHPSHDILLEGPKPGMYFVYVSSTYLNGFINYVDILGGYMIKSYKTDNEWKEAVKEIDKLINEPHTNLYSSVFDDVIILAKGANSYWLFWNDRDCSDCEIGRLPLDTFENDKAALFYLKRSVDHCFTEAKYIPKENFKGWITL